MLLLSPLHDACRTLAWRASVPVDQMATPTAQCCDQSHTRACMQTGLARGHWGHRHRPLGGIATGLGMAVGEGRRWVHGTGEARDTSSVPDHMVGVCTEGGGGLAVACRLLLNVWRHACPCLLSPSQRTSTRWRKSSVSWWASEQHLSRVGAATGAVDLHAVRHERLQLCAWQHLCLCVQMRNRMCVRLDRKCGCSARTHLATCVHSVAAYLLPPPHANCNATV